MTNIHLEPLGNGMEIFVSDSYHFSTDTILLADFSQPANGKRCADLGTGCGTIPLLWLKRADKLRVTAVELQEDACSLLQRSIAHNHLEEQLTVLHADLRALKGVLPFGAFDTVVCNPPYKPGGSGILNPEDAKTLARHEAACTLRLPDVTESMRRFGIEPKRLRLVQQRRTKAPKLFLLEGRRGGKRGFLDVLPTLFIEDENGGFSEEMLAIYGDYKRPWLKK